MNLLEVMTIRDGEVVPLELTPADEWQLLVRGTVEKTPAPGLVAIFRLRPCDSIDVVVAREEDVAPLREGWAAVWAKARKLYDETAAAL